MKSMLQEAHQELIRKSVRIDKEKKRAVAKLPFLQDPAGQLTDNSRLAARRLENICRKYAGDSQVREMINKAFNKFIDRGHTVYLKNLPERILRKILNAETNYTIPYDVAFKENSLSTLARPVIYASSRTLDGICLNNLLAKGNPWRKRLYLKKIEKGEVEKSKLKELEFPPTRSSVFNSALPVANEKSETKMKINS